MFDCIFSVISCFLLILLLKLFKKLLIEQEEAMNVSVLELSKNKITHFSPIIDLKVIYVFLRTT